MSKGCGGQRSRHRVMIMCRIISARGASSRLYRDGPEKGVVLRVRGWFDGRLSPKPPSVRFRTRDHTSRTFRTLPPLSPRGRKLPDWGFWCLNELHNQCVRCACVPYMESERRWHLFCKEVQANWHTEGNPGCIPEGFHNLRLAKRTNDHKKAPRRAKAGEEHIIEKNKDFNLNSKSTRSVYLIYSRNMSFLPTGPK